MHSFILCGGSVETRGDYIRKLTTPQTNFIHVTTDNPSLGIDDAHALIKQLSISSRLPRLVWIEEASRLTRDASNALLKLLEEPPANTTLYLSCENSANLLATIRSRAQTIILTVSSDSNKETYLPLIKKALPATAGDRIGLGQTLPTDRSELLAIFASLATEIHNTIPSAKTNASRAILHKIATLTLDTHAQLKANVATNLAVAHFFLHLPKTK